MLEIKHLSLKYKNFTAVNDVTFTIEEGEFFALCGSSGCGKTSLLRAIAGFETIDKGRIILNGEDITDMDPSLRGIGFIFQNYTLFPHFNVEKNIAYGLENFRYGKDKIDKQVQQVSKLLNIRNQLKKKPHELSGGQQQRVAIARAWVMHPKLLLLDEPFSSLDAPVRVSLLKELQRLVQKTGMTVIYVTHDIREALGYANRILLLNNGEIEQIGTPIDLYNHPINEFVARFIGSKNIISPQWAKALKLDVNKKYYISYERISIKETKQITSARTFQLVNILFQGFYWELELLNEYQKLIVYVMNPTVKYTLYSYYEADFLVEF